MKNYLKPDVEYLVFYTEEAIADDQGGDGGIGGAEMGSVEIGDWT